MDAEGENMGTYGTALYDNDTACDIRGDYVDMLRRGKTGEEATQILIQKNGDIWGDSEEEPLFWYALADTQWNVGQLLPAVKEKALFFLEQTEGSARWYEAGEEKAQAWQRSLYALKHKLLTPQPPKKKIPQYRLYRCPWQLGDVFAYLFSSDESKEKGFFGKYVVFRKVSEESFWPGHIVPVVQIYKWVGDAIPALESLEKMKLLEQGFYPSVFVHHPGTEKKYRITLLSTSQRVIPKNNLTYLGNISGEDLVPFLGHDYYSGNTCVAWGQKAYNNRFEPYVMDMYTAWEKEE